MQDKLYAIYDGEAHIVEPEYLVDWEKEFLALALCPEEACAKVDAYTLNLIKPGVKCYYGISIVTL